MLPEMDGLSLCRIIKGDRATAGTPIIMLTAKVEEIDRVLGLELDAKFGLYRVNFKTLERKPTSAARYYSYIIRNRSAVMNNGGEK